MNYQILALLDHCYSTDLVLKDTVPRKLLLKGQKLMFFWTMMDKTFFVSRRQHSMNIMTNHVYHIILQFSFAIFVCLVTLVS